MTAEFSLMLIKWFILQFVDARAFSSANLGLIEMGCDWEKGLQLYILIIWVQGWGGGRGHKSHSLPM